MGTDNASRRRRGVVAAGHTGDPELARAHLDDPVPVIRASSLRALRRLNVLAPDEVTRSLSDPDPLVRRVGVELAAAEPELPGLVQCLSDTDATVVEVSAWALGEWAADGTDAVVALIEVASSHDDSLCRESAVAALGAIGDPTGLATVLNALEDKATVRRRAVIALAAFEGKEAEAALEKCLTDRDWQVRQVAEDLLERRTGD